jgi:hypothetical protein
MKEIDAQYQATYFVGSLAEMKAEAERYKRQVELKQSLESRDALKIKIIRLLMETVDNLTEKAYEAAEAAGVSIRWH